MSNFKPINFFQISYFPFKDVFDVSQNAWEVFTSIEKYADSVLGDEKLQIGDGSRIDSSARIDGRLICGKDCVIADATLVRGVCILGDGVRIGHGVEIKNSIMLNNSAIAHLNYIGDSIIGNNVNIGGGAMLANWRFDKHTVKVKSDGKKIDTGLEKFGSLVGDGSNVGVNSVLNPGTVLGKNSIVFPLVSVTGVHGENSVIK